MFNHDKKLLYTHWVLFFFSNYFYFYFWERFQPPTTVSSNTHTHMEHFLSFSPCLHHSTACHTPEMSVFNILRCGSQQWRGSLQEITLCGWHLLFFALKWDFKIGALWSNLRFQGQKPFPALVSICPSRNASGSCSESFHRPLPEPKCFKATFHS